MDNCPLSTVGHKKRDARNNYTEAIVLCFFNDVFYWLSRKFDDGVHWDSNGKVVNTFYLNSFKTSSYTR